MPVKLRVRLALKPPETPIVAEVELPENEWEVVDRFRDYAAELETATLLQRDPPWRIEITSDGRGTITGHNLPPKIEVRELIHLLRPFILDREPTAFYKVVNVLSRHFTDPAFRTRFQWWRDRFSGKDSQEQLKLQVGNLVLNSEKTLQLWLNAYEYHRDDDKREVMKSLYARAPWALIECTFVDLLTRQAEAVALAARFLGHLSGPETASRRLNDQGHR